MAESAERTHELYESGLAYIRAAIRMTLAEVDAEIAAAGILHPAWSRRLPPPDVVPLSVMPARAPVVTVEFTGREIQASCRGVDSAEVCHKVRSFGLEYQRMRTDKEARPHLGPGEDQRKDAPAIPCRRNGDIAHGLAPMDAWRDRF